MRSVVNIYTPLKGKIEEARELCPDVKLYRVRVPKEVHYYPGQFFMLSLWGYGEVPISVCSLDDTQTLEFTVRKAGFVTSAIHQLQAGDTIWLRGPYGRRFPLEMSYHRDVVVVAGGIGLAPLRAVIQYLLKERRKVKRVTLLYGSRTPDGLLYREEYDTWRASDVKVVLTVDCPSDGWRGNVGVVTTLWHQVEGELREAVAYVCGPPVMIKAALTDLFLLGMPADRIVTTLEAHMKCGVGKCGHCYNDGRFICTDGPVFTYKEIKEWDLTL